jgi:amino acid transporter
MSIFRACVDSFKPLDDRNNVEMQEKGAKENDGVNDGKLKRDLHSRHLQMIAIGGSIGTGLFVGSGGSFVVGGPANVLIAFLLVGSMLFAVVQALGELAVLFPVQGSFAVYGTKFLDPAWGFAMGWNYGLQWLVTLPLELSAASIVVDYWKTDVNNGVFITIFLILIVCINMFGVKGYGEAEFVFSIIKVIAVIGFIICAIVINVGGSPAKHYFGVETWSNPGAFNNGFPGLCACFVNAAFAFGGTELVGLAAAETSNPVKTLPKATKQVFWRILFFYVTSLLLIGFIVPYTNPNLLNGASDASASPFVIAIELGGIQVLPSIFNAVILIAVLSVGNSSTYGSSRTIAALSKIGQAPRFLAYIDRRGRPIISLVLALLFGGLAYIGLASSGETVFNWLLAISGLSQFFTWGSICLCHIRFRQGWKAQGHTLEEIPFRSAVGVIGSYYGLIFNILCLIAQFYVAVWPPGTGGTGTVEEFFEAYLAVPVVIIFYVGYKIIRWSESNFVRNDDMDVDTGRRTVESADNEPEVKDNACLKCFDGLL